MISRHTAISWLVMLAVTMQIMVFILNPEVTIINHAVNWVAMGITGFCWGMRWENKMIRKTLEEALRVANAYRTKDGLTPLGEKK